MILSFTYMNFYEAIHISLTSQFNKKQYRIREIWCGLGQHFIEAILFAPFSCVCQPVMSLVVAYLSPLVSLLRLYDNHISALSYFVFEKLKMNVKISVSRRKQKWMLKISKFILQVQLLVFYFDANVDIETYPIKVCQKSLLIHPYMPLIQPKTLTSSQMYFI